jgi:acyl-CoA dehydrogenase
MNHELNQLMTFSEEQSMLQDTAMTFFSDKSPMAAVRAQIETRDGFERGLWNEMVALGWTSLAVPEQQGGGGLGLAEAICIAEPMGRHLCSAPFLSTQLFVQALLNGGDEGQHAEYLSRIVGGAIGTVALFESDGNWDLSSIAARAERDRGGFVLTGSKSLVTDAEAADIVLASVRVDGAPALAIIARDELADGALRREIVIDETRRSFAMNLDGLRIPVLRMIEGAAAARAFASIRNAALLLLAAEASGGTAGVLRLVVDYLNTRTAFGRKIGSYQALKHPCVEMLIGLERARSHVYHAASLLAAGADAEIALRMAKAQACDALAFAGDRAIQFHGAFGFTYECDAQLFLRRALWLQYGFGDAGHHRRHLANQLLGAT